MTLSPVNGSTNRQIVGIDIGGANLKYASHCGRTLSRPFAMWRRHEQLASTLAEDLADFGGSDEIAVTMTGELADCFLDRELGVLHIVEHTEQAAAAVGITRVRYYGVDGNFYAATGAKSNVDLIAAANWHALASFVAADVADALLIDVGSTTTDIIPICDGRVATEAHNDFDRLLEGSLVYVGCQRTPVCALLDHLCVGGRQIPVMNEWFATIDDARLLLGFQAEDPGDNDSADGKPRTVEFAANRLARMIGLDRRQVDVIAARELARQVADAAKSRIGAAVQKSACASGLLVLSGHGQDLVETSGATEIIQFSDRFGSACSRAAPAYAVARLCQRYDLNDTRIAPAQ